jgi:hypothetical protein
MDTFGLSQHINFPTHTSGHTLDLLLSRSTSQTITDITRTDPSLSDHSALLAQLSFPIKSRAPKIAKSVRCLSKINFAKLNAEHQNSTTSQHLTCPHIWLLSKRS